MTFEPAISQSHLVLLAVAALAVTLAAAWMSRRRFSFAATLLRLAIFALVLLVLANPVERGELALPGPAAWQAVLLDTSASMSLGGDRPRWREGLDWLAPLLQNDAPARLATFDTTANFSAQPPTEARGAASRLGQAIERVLEQAGDTPPAQIVVVSDGIFDDAPQIAAAVAKARSRQVVVSTHLVGRDESVPNLAFKRFRAPRFAAAESRVIVSYEVASSGLPPATPLAVTIRGEDGRVLAEDAWTLQENNGPREVPVALTLRPERFTASLRVADGEVTDADNALAFRIELTDPKIRVLYAEGSQGPFEVGTGTMNALAIMPTAFRRAGDIECDIFTMERQDARGLPLYYVRGFNENQSPVLDRGHGIPTDRAGWERYDVVIISDIDRRTFSAEQMEWVRQLVTERGGGFAMFGGNQGFDTGNYDQTIWEKLIPVDCLEFGFGHGWRGVKPQFPAAQRRHPILRLAADEAVNNAILDCHPAFRGYHDIRRVKPGAVALAKVEDSEAPLIAVQEYGRGRTMAFLSDPAGGWADGGYEGFWGPGMLADFLGAEPPEAAGALIADGTLAPNEFYNRFWVNSIRWLAESSVRRQGRPLLARSETAMGRPGEPLAISAELRAGAPEEMANWSVGARIEGAGQARVALQFDRQRREFIGEIGVPPDCAAGDLKVVVDAVSGDAAFTDAVTVPVVRIAPDARLMADIAQAGGGRVLSAASEAGEVFANARAAASNARISYAQPLWDRAWFWAVMIGLLSLEWWLRRSSAGAPPVESPPGASPGELLQARRPQSFRQAGRLRYFLFATLLAFSENAQAARVCLIFGNPGDTEHRERFAKLQSQLERTFRQRFGIRADALTTFHADDGHAREKLLALVTDIAAKARPDAAVWLVFIGHANTTRTGANFNVPGPDVTETDLRDALNAAHAAGPVVVLFPTAASGRMVRAMAGPNRLIFAATRPSDEDNETELPAILADALDAPATDADHDGFVSVLELFQACVPAVRAAYERLGFMQKEMPGLDANGDGRATQRPSPEDAEPAARVGLKIAKP